MAHDIITGLQLGAIDSDVLGAVGAQGTPVPTPCATLSRKRGPGVCLSVFHSSRTGLPSPNNLQEVQVALINNTMCNHLYQMPDFSRNIWGDMVCAGSPSGGKDACFVSVTSPHHGLLGPVPAIPTSNFHMVPHGFTWYPIPAQANPGI